MKLKKVLNEVKTVEPLFDINNVKDVCKELEEGIKAPVVKTTYSTLGGSENVSILILISIDEKKDWPNGMLENSRYTRLYLERNHVLEQFTNGRCFAQKKLRKSRPKTIKDVIKKLNTYIKLVEKIKEE